MQSTAIEDYAQKEVFFTQTEYDARLKGLRERMKAAELDGFLAFSPASHYYLTGYQSKNTSGYRVLIVPLDTAPCLLVWQLEVPGVRLTTRLDNDNIFGYPNNYHGMLDTLELMNKRGLGGKRVGLEENAALLDVDTYKKITEGFSGQCVNASNLVKEGMSIKSEKEIEYITKAARITEKGIAAAIEVIKEGTTDNQVAKAAYAAMIDAGSEYFSVQPYVTAGMRSGIPHTTFLRTPLKKGDSILLEMSGVFNRYHAPMMRSAFVGETTQRAIEIFNGCKAALANVLATMVAGKTFDEVAKAGKEGIALISEPIVFHHTYGYSIGLGFPPTWADNNDLRLLEGDQTKLKPGMVFHHTMSVRHPGRYGICLSETSVVTATGCEVITQFERKLFEAQ